MDWAVDFDARVISGTITHDLEVVADTRVLVMDAWDINVYGVKRVKSGAAKRMKEFGTGDPGIYPECIS